jgi:uncharacterized protein with PIN domain
MDIIKKCLEEFPYCYQRTALDMLISNNEIYKAQKLAAEFLYSSNSDKLFEHIEKLREAIRKYEPPPTVQKHPKCDDCNKYINVKWVKEPLLYEVYEIHQWLWMCDNCYRKSCEDI